MKLQRRRGEVRVVLVELVGGQRGRRHASRSGRAHAQEILGELESPRIVRQRIHLVVPGLYTVVRAVEKRDALASG